MIRQRSFAWYNGKLKYRVEIELGSSPFPEPKPEAVTIRIFDDNLFESYPCVTAVRIPLEVLREALSTVDEWL